MRYVHILLARGRVADDWLSALRTCSLLTLLLVWTVTVWLGA